MQALDKTELMARLQEANEAANAFISASPLWVQVWIMVMTVALLPAFVFAFRRAEARWVVLGLVQTAVFTPFLIAAVGPSRVWGLTHILFWTGPAIVCIAAVLREGFGSWSLRWLALAGGVMSVSLLFDVLDVLRFFIE